MLFQTSKNRVEYRLIRSSWKIEIDCVGEAEPLVTLTFAFPRTLVVAGALGLLAVFSIFGYLAALRVKVGECLQRLKCRQCQLGDLVPFLDASYLNDERKEILVVQVVEVLVNLRKGLVAGPNRRRGCGSRRRMIAKLLVLAVGEPSDATKPIFFK